MADSMQTAVNVSETALAAIPPVPIAVRPMPTAAEVNTLGRIANDLFSGRAVSSAYKTPQQVFAVVLAGRELGVGPMQALTDLQIIEGKLSMTADAMHARALQFGGRITVIETTDERCAITFERGEQKQTVVWDVIQARRAQLDQRGTWRKYPRAMLRARVLAEGCRMMWPDLLRGVYTPDEMGAADDDGMIDVQWSEGPSEANGWGMAPAPSPTPVAAAAVPVPPNIDGGSTAGRETPAGEGLLVPPPAATPAADVPAAPSPSSSGTGVGEQGQTPPVAGDINAPVIDIRRGPARNQLHALELIVQFWRPVESEWRAELREVCPGAMSVRQLTEEQTHQLLRRLASRFCPGWGGCVVPGLTDAMLDQLGLLPDRSEPQSVPEVTGFSAPKRSEK